MTHLIPDSNDTSCICIYRIGSQFDSGPIDWRAEHLTDFQEEMHTISLTQIAHWHPFHFISSLLFTIPRMTIRRFPFPITNECDNIFNPKSMAKRPNPFAPDSSPSKTNKLTSQTLPNPLSPRKSSHTSLNINITQPHSPDHEFRPFFILEI